MRKYHINLIDGIQPINQIQTTETDQKLTSIQYPVPRNKVGRFFFRLSIILLVIIIIFSTNTIFSSQGIMTQFGRLSFWEGMARLAIGKDKLLKGELTNRVNILILGMGGAEHEGPYLTDTIILASLKPSNKDLALFSIPRDLYVPAPEFGWQKINAVNSLGMFRSDDGASLTSRTVSEIFEIPIHYWLRIDFSAFKNLIDWLGGVEIEVERSFVDYQYPAAYFQFRTIGFEAGRQTMNGERALQFARSRHGTNNESTDFARMKRQQKIILAVKEKMEKENLIASPQKIWEIYNIFSDKISTNLDFAEMVRLAKIVSQVKEDNIRTYTFEAGPDGLLYSEIAINGAYILRPKSGSFKEMAQIIKDIFLVEEKKPKQTTPSQTQASTAESLNLPQNKIKLIILNGTNISGLAKRTKTKLESLNYQVLRIGNAPTKDYQKTVIYSVKEIDSKATESLSKELGVEIAILPDNLKYLVTPETDFLVILGSK